MKTTAVMAAIAVLGTGRTPGCQRPDGTDDNSYIAAGAAMQTNLLSLRVWLADKNTGQIAGVVNASATYYNERYVLTAAHNLTDVSQYNIIRCEVATGSNYASNRGTVVPSFSYAIHPSFDPNNTGSGPDVAILRLASVLPGNRATIGGASQGDVVKHGGFGNTAAPSVNMYNDHSSRGWTGAVEGWVPSSQNPTYYDETSFYPYINLNGHGLNGDSGGPVYNSAGQLIGINKAQTGDTGMTGSTIYLKLAQTDVSSWISQNTTNINPNPARLSISGPGNVTVTGDTNQIYGILASTNLATWQEIGTVTNLTGSVNFQDPQAFSIPNRFYRAVAK